MLIEDVILQTIAGKVVNYAWDKVDDRIRKKLGLDHVQRAFTHALRGTFEKFEKQYPQWSVELFDISFFEHEGAPILSQFLIRNGHPNPTDLAETWANSLNLRSKERRTTYIRELEPTAANFLENLSQSLLAEPELQGINDSRSLEQLSEDIGAIRQKLGAEQATIGTRLDYLHWLIDRNLYLDPRGTFQTQRQIQMKLNDVYISLRAHREELFNMVDRRLLDSELVELKAKMANLPAEEVEDQWEQLLIRFRDKPIKRRKRTR